MVKKIPLVVFGFLLGSVINSLLATTTTPNLGLNRLDEVADDYFSLHPINMDKLDNAVGSLTQGSTNFAYIVFKSTNSADCFRLYFDNTGIAQSEQQACN